MRLNRPAIGFILGLLMPLIGIGIVFLLFGEDHDLGAFLDRLARYPRNAAKVLSLGILANVLPFLLFTNRRLDYAAKGVFIATMLYAVAIILLRFVW